MKKIPLELSFISSSFIGELKTDKINLRIVTSPFNWLTILPLIDFKFAKIENFSPSEVNEEGESTQMHFVVCRQG